MNPPKKKIHLIGTRGCGSVIAEAFLTLAEIPFDREEIDYSSNGPEKKKLLTLNPMGQVPTLALPNGSVLTESLAVAAYADAQTPAAGLIPKDGDDFVKFWRWVVFIVAAIYPTFTYGDSPGKWVKNEEGEKELRESTDRWREKLWRLVEAETGTPYFLGERFSAIDVYLKAMVHWRPRNEWFAQHCPKIAAVADRVAIDRRLADLWRKNFS